MKDDDEKDYDEIYDRLGAEVGFMVGLIGVCAVLLLVIIGDLYGWFF